MSTNFPTSLDSYSDLVDNVTPLNISIINDIQDAIEAIEAKIGAGSYSYTLHDAVYNFIYSGQKLWLYENVAPTGWSIESLSDCLVGVAGGTGAYNVVAGNTGGQAWSTLKAHYHNVEHTHTITPHTHNILQLSSAGASYTYNSSGVLVAVPQGNWFDSPSQGHIRDSAGVSFTCLYVSGSSGQDAWTQLTGAGATGAASITNSGAQNNSDNRLPAALGIIVVKS